MHLRGKIFGIFVGLLFAVATLLQVAATQLPTVSSLVPSSSSITQGGASALTVTISAAQPTPSTVGLSSSAPGVAFVPSSVVIPSGQLSAVITVDANTTGTAQITANLNGSSVTSVVTVTSALPTIASLLPPTTPVTLGANAILTVTLSAAQPTGTVISLATDPLGILAAPPTVTVPAGQLSVPFPIGTIALGTASVRASLNGSISEAAVQVTPPPAAVVALLPPA